MSVNAQDRNRSGAPPIGDRLDSWKEIAAYIKRDIRTVQRWEKYRGLPVRRLQHDAQGTVFAYRSEIDKWWHSHQQTDSQVTASLNRVRGRPMFYRWWFLAATLMAAISLALFSYQLFPHRSGHQSAMIPRQLTANPIGNRVLSAAISPDGKNLAYSDDSGILLKEIDTGETHPLPSTAGLYVRNWFPDGSKLLANRYRDPSLWIISVLNGTAHKVKDDAGTGAVSPDGLYIAFMRNVSAEIWIMEAGGENPRKIVTAQPGETFVDFCWSPGGQRLAYVKGNGYKLAIESRDLKGDQLTVIVSDRRLNVGGATGLSWLPDGRVIYTLQNLSSNQLDNNLWAIKTDIRTGKTSGEPRPVTGLSGFLLLNLSVSADGKRLAFLKAREQFGVYVGELEGNAKRLRNPKRLTLDNWNNLPNTWTGDSQAVIFESDRDGGWEIFKQGIDRSTPEAMVVGAGDYHQASLNLDNTWLLFWASPSRKGAHSSRLMRVPVSGGSLVEVLTAIGFASHQCAFLHSSLCVLAEQTEDQLIFSAFDPAQGRGTELKRMDIETPEISWSLSPNGERIAVADLRRIRILDLRAGTTQNLAPKAKIGELESVAWSRDGKGLFLSASPEFESTLFHIDMKGNVRQLVQYNGWIGNLTPSPDGKYLAFAETTQEINAAMIENF